MPPLDWVAGKHVESIFLVTAGSRPNLLWVGPHLGWWFWFLLKKQAEQTSKPHSFIDSASDPACPVGVPVLTFLPKLLWPWCFTITVVNSNQDTILLSSTYKTHHGLATKSRSAKGMSQFSRITLDSPPVFCVSVLLPTTHSTYSKFCLFSCYSKLKAKLKCQAYNLTQTKLTLV